MKNNYVVIKIKMKGKIRFPATVEAKGRFRLIVSMKTVAPDKLDRSENRLP